MRNKPLPGFYKNSPLHNDKKKVKKKKKKDDFGEGFMHPPYRVQKDLAGNVKYYHGFKKPKSK